LKIPNPPKYATLLHRIRAQTFQLNTDTLVTLSEHPNREYYAEPVVKADTFDAQGNPVSIALYENEYTVIKGRTQ
jgi:hypothetical protein